MEHRSGVAHTTKGLISKILGGANAAHFIFGLREIITA
jgi:hypothetical protein